MLPAIGLAEISTILAQHMVAMLRIGAFLLASPVFGGRFVPLPVRIMATAVIAIPVILHAPMPDMATISELRFVGVVMTELCVGLVGGLVLAILFGAASIAGDRIASTAGLGFAAQFDPAGGGQTPIVASIFSLALMSVFIGSDGHLHAISMILNSYKTFPIGSSFAPNVLITAGIQAGAMMFAISASLMLPVVGLLLLLNIVVGILTRSAPQLNVFSFGFPITMSATMILIFIFAPSLVAAFGNLVDTGLSFMAEMLETAGG